MTKSSFIDIHKMNRYLNAFPTFIYAKERELEAQKGGFLCEIDH